MGGGGADVVDIGDDMDVSVCKAGGPTSVSAVPALHLQVPGFVWGAGVSGTVDMSSASDTEKTGTPESVRSNGVGGTAVRTGI
jgi:hypothetical protein